MPLIRRALLCPEAVEPLSVPLTQFCCFFLFLRCCDIDLPLCSSVACKTNKQGKESKKKHFLGSFENSTEARALLSKAALFLFSFFLWFYLRCTFLLLIMYAKQLDEEEEEKKKNRNEEVVVVSELGTFRMKALLFSFSRCCARRPPHRCIGLLFLFLSVFFFSAVARRRH